MSIAGVKKHFANWREWEFNPILIKELRQAVRSQILTGMFFFLLVLFFSISVYVLLQESSQTLAVFRTGRSLFIAYLGVLVIGCVFFIPLYTGIRVAREQHESDLMLYTPMPVSKLVHGKILSGLYIAGLFFSVDLPFMMFSNLLRGIDWLTIQFVLSMLLLAVFIAVLTAMAVAVLPMPVIVKSILGIGLTCALAIFCIFLFGFLVFVVESGASSFVFSLNFWFGFCVTLTIGLFPIIILYGLCVSFIAPHRQPDNSSMSEAQPNL
ncbi:MAG: hypothetical protein WDM76_06295 [Limisphaerales bacterium]